MRRETPEKAMARVHADGYQRKIRILSPCRLDVIWLQP